MCRMATAAQQFLRDADVRCLALACRRARVLHPLLLTVFLPDHWHLICAPAYPLTISVAMKSLRQWRVARGE